MKVRITNVQRFCLNDGPGIRTTIFFKGCSLKCPWCCNPETINYDFDYYTIDGNNRIFGYDIEESELEKEILKDLAFYKNDGGVTFSGGEALLQLSKLTTMLKKLKKQKIHVALETSLAVDKMKIEKVMNYVDLFYVDLKILDDTLAKEAIHCNVVQYLDNINILIKNKKNIIFRFPANKEYTLHPNNMKAIRKFISAHKGINIEIYKTHNLGESKYKLLNKEYVPFEEISDEVLLNVKKDFITAGAKVNIISL